MSSQCWWFKRFNRWFTSSRYLLRHGGWCDKACDAKWTGNHYQRQTLLGTIPLRDGSETQKMQPLGPDEVPEPYASKAALPAWPGKRVIYTFALSSSNAALAKSPATTSKDWLHLAAANDLCWNPPMERQHKQTHV
jgi:hypothetical protein